VYNALAFTSAPIDDEDLVIVTLIGLEKYYSQFRTSIEVRETFFNIQNLITLLISEKMKVVGTSFNGGLQESAFHSNLIVREVKVLNSRFEVDMEACMVDIVNM
jgi:hypothetical protein